MAAENEDTLPEEEVFQALKSGMSDTVARRLAKLIADDPSSPETIRLEKAEGRTSSIYTEDLLLLLSLVSSETQRKAQLRVARQRLQLVLTPEQHVKWEARRSKLRQQLIDAGNLPARE